MIFPGKLTLAVLVTILLFFPGCPKPAAKQTTNNKNSVTEVETISETSSFITIIAAGDNLIHDIIYNRARVAGEDRFDFSPAYAQIKPIIEKADIAFVNQETVMGGKQLGYSGYPVFNTPQDAGLGLIDAGFNVINHASNHSMDRGEAAVFGTIDFWKSQGVNCLGIFKSEEERKTGKHIMEKNGIKTGFLSYTYGLNGFVLPRDKPWLVGLIDKEVMAREIGELRPHCDFLVVSMHWGSEFLHTVNDYQKEMALFLAEQKVDLILGHHPHVTAPVEVIDRPDGKKLFVYYSLGDILSHTQSAYTQDTVTGALAYIQVKKTGTKDTVYCTVETATVIPTVCHYTLDRKKPFTAYPLWDYTDELASIHFKKNLTVKYLNDVARQVFGLRVLDRELFERLSAR